MPDPIYQFSSLEEAITILKRFGNEFEIPSKQWSKERLIRDSVQSNILRAFRNLEFSTPSAIWRQWAGDNFKSILKDLKTVNSKKDYYKFIQGYGDSLIRRWAKETKNPDHYLQYGPALKMINLLLKWIQESDKFRQENKFKYQQVPFDSFSLQPLRKIINQVTDTKYRITIPANASMGFINTPQLYRVLMDCIYKLSKLSNIYPIAYDYWCWEEKHDSHYFE